MGLEAGTYISDLNASWPLSTDQVRYGAGHLRLLKATVKATFPNINGAVTLTVAELNQFVGFNVAAINALTLGGQLPAFFRDASNLNAGIVPDVRIASTSVLQYQALFELNGSQITTSVFTRNASFSVEAAQAEGIVICDSSSAIVVTLLGGTVATGDSIGFIRRGTGAVTFAAGAGQTLNYPVGLTILNRHGKATATYAATNTWELSGNV